MIRSLPALALALAAGAAPCAHADPAPLATLPPSLFAGTPIGTWDVTVTTFDCDTRVARPPFHSILSFGPGGTEVETTDNPALAPNIRSTAFGSWAYAGFGRVAMLTKAFLFLPAAAGGTSVQTVGHAIRLQGATHFDDTAELSVTNAAGTVTAHACATATGTRF